MQNMLICTPKLSYLNNSYYISRDTDPDHDYDITTIQTWQIRTQDARNKNGYKWLH